MENFASRRSNSGETTTTRAKGVSIEVSRSAKRLRNLRESARVTRWAACRSHVCCSAVGSSSSPDGRGVEGVGADFLRAFRPKGRMRSSMTSRVVASKVIQPPVLLKVVSKGLATKKTGNGRTLLDPNQTFLERRQAVRRSATSGTVSHDVLR